jgi:hypothetical protein
MQYALPFAYRLLYAAYGRLEVVLRLVETTDRSQVPFIAQMLIDPSRVQWTSFKSCSESLLRANTIDGGSV